MTKLKNILAQGGVVWDKEPMDGIRRIMNSCIQCGTCTASCPSAFGMDHPPRRMWRLLQAGDLEGVFSSRSFILCSSCYMCRLRCPRGLPLTECIGELKRLSATLGMPVHQTSTLFYKAFLKSVRQHGRVNEIELMTAYFMGLKNPVIPVRFMSLGLKLMFRKKVFPVITHGKEDVLGRIFKKVEELEAGS